MIRFAKPRNINFLLTKVYTYAFFIGFTLIALGLTWGIGFTPTDSIQGISAKIIYLHVPSAWASLFLFLLLGGASFISLIWRLPTVSLSTLSLARLSALFGALTLLTGMLWAKPMWGTWWVWDARLTATFIQFLLTLAIISLHPDHNVWSSQRRNAQIFSVIGLINLPIIKGSVIWWNTLHQGQTFSLTQSWNIDWEMAAPLFVIFIGFLSISLAIVSLDVRGSILWQRINTLRH